MATDSLDSYIRLILLNFVETTIALVASSFGYTQAYGKPTLAQLPVKAQVPPNRTGIVNALDLMVSETLGNSEPGDVSRRSDG